MARNMSYQIQLLKTSAGTRFNFQQENVEKIITWAGSHEALTLQDEALALVLQKSLIDNPCWFDKNDNLIIPSPLYFLLSVEHSGIDSLMEQIENRAILWSQDACFHRNENERIAGPQNAISSTVNDFLTSLELKPLLLPLVDFDNWDELEDHHFLPDSYQDTLNHTFDALNAKEQIVIMYFAFNSPHLVAVMAWLKNFFKDDEAFAHYTLVMEAVVCPVNISAEDFERELHLRVSMFADIHHFLGK